MLNLTSARVDAAHVKGANVPDVYCPPVLRIFNNSLVEETFHVSIAFLPLCNVDVAARSCTQLQKEKREKLLNLRYRHGDLILRVVV